MSNVVVSESLRFYEILVLASGATRNNTEVYVDKGSECPEDVANGRIIVEVGEPEISDQLLELTELKLTESIDIPPQYSLDDGDIQVEIRGGLVIVNLHALEDRIISLEINEE